MNVIFKTSLLIIGIIIPLLLQFIIGVITLRLGLSFGYLMNPYKRGRIVSIIFLVLTIFWIQMDYNISDNLDTIGYGMSLTCCYYFFRPIKI